MRGLRAAAHRRAAMLHGIGRRHTGQPGTGGTGGLGRGEAARGAGGGRCGPGCGGGGPSDRLRGHVDDGDRRGAGRARCGGGGGAARGRLLRGALHRCGGGRGRGRAARRGGGLGRGGRGGAARERRCKSAERLTRAGEARHPCHVVADTRADEHAARAVDILGAGIGGGRKLGGHRQVAQRLGHARCGVERGTRAGKQQDTIDRHEPPRITPGKSDLFSPDSKHLLAHLVVAARITAESGGAPLRGARRGGLRGR